MILTFQQGGFVLSRGGNSVYPDNSRESQAVSFKDANHYSHCADVIASRILKQLFIQHYPTPYFTSPLPPFFDAHQKDGIDWVLSRSRSYLAHAPGAGKTFQALYAAHVARRGKSANTSGASPKALFIVPPTLTENWVRDLLKLHSSSYLDTPFGLYPDLAVLPDSAKQGSMRWDRDYWIIPDSMLSKKWVLDGIHAEKRFRLVAVDEASRMKTVGAERTIALFGGTLKSGEKVPSIIRKARHAVLLDGSPMPNRPMELWAPLYAMAPETIDFMNETEFGLKYCGATMNKWGKWEFKHSSNEAELRQRLRKDFMHVVTEGQLVHPERLRKLVFMTVGRNAVIKEFERRYVAISLPSEFSEDESRGDLARMRREIGLQKIKFAVRYIRERLAQGESVLVFGWHREVCEQIAESLKADLVYGGTNDVQREQSIAKFQAGKSSVLVGNIGSLGRGHNIQRADRVVFVEYSWTDELNKQCEKRVSRKGNESASVPCDYIVLPGTTDEVILRSVFTKETRVKKIIG